MKILRRHANENSHYKDKILRRKQDTNTTDDKWQVSRIPDGKMWRKKSDYKDSKETQISNIGEVSKDDDEHNNAINKNDIHYEGKKDGYVKVYIDEYKDEDDEERYNDDCGILF